MNSVKMDRQQLLTIVKENKEKHIAEHVEAIEGYKLAVIKVAKFNLKMANGGDVEKFKFAQMPRAPQTYEDSYTRAIRMLELSVDSIIELEEHIFNQLVLDEWAWKHDFAATSALYKSN